MLVEIARVNGNGIKNRMELARAIQKLKDFRLYRISEIVETIRSYEHSGLLVTEGDDIVIYHNI